MTKAELIDQYGDNAESLCKAICDICTANDAYCPTPCKTCGWVQRNYEKAVERLMKLDGELYEFCKRVRTWKG